MADCMNNNKKVIVPCINNNNLISNNNSCSNKSDKHKNSIINCSDKFSNSNKNNERIKVNNLNNSYTKKNVFNSGSTTLYLPLKNNLSALDTTSSALKLPALVASSSQQTSSSSASSLNKKHKMELNNIISNIGLQTLVNSVGVNINNNSNLINNNKKDGQSTNAVASSMNNNHKISLTQETDDCRKKRCADRYDSSESSDSGVATLSCTDSSTASSDSSDPGSPYSPSSICEDTLNTTTIVPSSTSTPIQITAINSTLASIPVSSVTMTIGGVKSGTAVVAPHSARMVNGAHNWPWNNNHNTNNSNTNGKLKRIMTGGDITISKRVRTASADKSKNRKSEDDDLLQTPQTKITGFFKTQMKPLNSNMSKKEINTPVMSVSITPTSSSTPLTTTMSSAQGKKGVGGLQKYFNLISNATPQQQAKLQKEMDFREIPTTTTITAPSIVTSKKTERKTAKVAPNLRKQQQNLQSSTIKKPVTIAPRANQKIAQKLAHLTTQPNHQMQQHQQHQNQHPAVVLATIRIPTSIDQHTGVITTSSGATFNNNKLGPIYQLAMPNLVQIQNKLYARPGNQMTNQTQPQNNLQAQQTTGQFLLNGAVIKLQQMPNSSDKILTQTQPSQPTIVPFVTTSSSASSSLSSATNQTSGGKFMANHQVFMTTTTPSLILNGVGYHTANGTIPALHPISHQNVLPSISTILPNQQFHHHHHHQQQQQHHHQQQTHIPMNNNFTTKIPIATFSPVLTTQQQQPPHQTTPPPTLQYHNTSNLTIPSSITHTHSVPSFIPPLTIATSLSSTSAPITAQSIKLLSEPPKLVPVSSTPLKIDTQSHYHHHLHHQIMNKVVAPIAQQQLQQQPQIESISTPTTPVKQLLSPRVPSEPISIAITPPSPVTSAIESITISTTTTTTTTASAIVALAMSPNCLPSPKSLILEKIQQKSMLTSPLSPLLLTSLTSSSSSLLSPLKSPIIETEFSNTANLPESAKSPILSQPKTIRFPPLNGEIVRIGSRIIRKSDGRIVGMCYWDNCTEKYDTNSKLLDHMQTSHVNSQTGPFACLWSGCKVYGKESCSKQWLERHVPTIHGGTKPFKCIFGGCGMRFGSHLALTKHVNSHFNSVECQNNSTKKSSDPPIPKQLRKNGKKLRYRRQPWSARMFDFFDTGVMEGLQHRLHITGQIACGSNGMVTFKGRLMARRVTADGVNEILVKWNPCDILPDEWITETTEIKVTKIPQKSIAINSMTIPERQSLMQYLKESNKHKLLNTNALAILNMLTSKTHSSIKFLSSTISAAATTTTQQNGVTVAAATATTAIALPTIKKHYRKPPKATQLLSS